MALSSPKYKPPKYPTIIRKVPKVRAEDIPDLKVLARVLRAKPYKLPR